MTTPSTLELPWSRALVVGLGRSGLAAARMLTRGGVTVVGYDQRTTIDDIPTGLRTVLGVPELPNTALAGVDLVVLSPGVPPGPVRERVAAIAPDAFVCGELSLALNLVGTANTPWRPVPTVMVTGTNGKSTVTALAAKMFEAEGRRVFAGGNLGEPLCDMMLRCLDDQRAWPEHLVLECSSFQLETLRSHPSSVAMIINVAPDHLDRYPSMESYAHTKARVFSGLVPDGLAVLDAEDPWTEALIPRHPNVAFVGGHPGATIEGASTDQSLVLDDGTEYPRSVLALAGRHNAKNALFALLAARHLGVSESAIRRALAEFSGLPHRMQLVAEIAGVAYFDDSKATNVASVVASLSGFGRRIVLIAGGRAKGDDLTQLAPLFRGDVGALVAIGEAAPMLLGVAGDVVIARHAASLDDAVAAARSLAHAGDAVVLSPACASYDQFRSYAERGDAFAAAVRALAEP